MGIVNGRAEMGVRAVQADAGRAFRLTRAGRIRGQADRGADRPGCPAGRPDRHGLAPNLVLDPTPTWDDACLRSLSRSVLSLGADRLDRPPAAY